MFAKWNEWFLEKEKNSHTEFFFFWALMFYLVFIEEDLQAKIETIAWHGSSNYKYTL